MDPVPDPLLLRKSGSAGNRTRDLCICSQKLWPLDHRGGQLFTLHLQKLKFASDVKKPPLLSAHYFQKCNMHYIRDYINKNIKRNYFSEKPGVDCNTLYICICSIICNLCNSSATAKRQWYDCIVIPPVTRDFHSLSERDNCTHSNQIFPVSCSMA